jgi:hypothetical protein
MPPRKIRSSAHIHDHHLRALAGDIPIQFAAGNQRRFAKAGGGNTVQTQEQYESAARSIRHNASKKPHGGFSHNA